jgi:mannose-6-phosphate isomerase
MTELYPLLLEPTLHVKVWGGRKLQTEMNKPLPTGEPYGESWEVHDTSVVANGPLKGQTVGDLLQRYGADLIGRNHDPAEGLPLLVKLLDAADWLSVQVHPDDEQAAELEGQPRGKTEAWFILAADPTAKLIIGVQPGTDREAMAQAIRETRLDDLLVAADIIPGDVLYIPAGTVHAIGPGVLLYEIQQSSDTTYRLYDWGRMGLDGKPRPLHIDKGVRVSNVDSLPTVAHPDDGTQAEVRIVESQFFVTTLHRLHHGATQTLDTQGTHFHTLTCIAGAITVRQDGNEITLNQGQSALIPAAAGQYSLHGDGVVLRSHER